jgi:hypothetical protein
MISFFESVLPGLQTIEGKKLDAKLTVGNATSDQSEVFPRILQFTKLLLTVAAETGAAIEQNRYKDFDALVGNFGCQITAFDLQRKVRNSKLREEAVRVSQQARIKLEELEHTFQQRILVIQLPMIKLLQKPPYFQLTMLEILRQAGLDFSISPDLRDLLRYRLLKLINDNKMVGTVEVPCTNVALLFEKVDQIKQNETALKKLIDAIQMEESKKAAFFIRQAASEMNPEENPRACIIQRLLSERFERKSKGIVSLPLVYNTEACLRNYQGIVLIKNKLSNCLGKIQGAAPQRVFLKVPGDRILNEREIANIPDHESLIVLEGIVLKGVSLAEIINDSGLIPLVLSNCAEEPQFANLNQGDQGIIDDEEARLELEDFKRLNLKATKFALDHFYCASMGEEK